MAENPGMPASALAGMAVEDMLEHVNVPSYLIDTTGVIRWVNPAARAIVGDVRGRQFTWVERQRGLAPCP